MNIKFIVLVFAFFVALATAKFTCQCNLSNTEARLIAVKDKSLCLEECNKITKEEVYSTECNFSTCTCTCGKKVTACKKKSSTHSSSSGTGSGASGASGSSGSSGDSGSSSTGGSSTGGSTSSTSSAATSSSAASSSSSAAASSSSSSSPVTGNADGGSGGTTLTGLMMEEPLKTTCAKSDYCECAKELISFKIL